MQITLATVLASLPLTLAHTRFTTLYVNGVSQGDGTCIRQDQDPGTTTNYVDSIVGAAMACGTDGDIPVADTCNVNAGDTISLEHRMWPDASQPGAIDVSHKGNTAIYMKRVNSMNDAVQGDGWFKIFWDGYAQDTSLWGTDHMNARNGMVTTTIPSDLAAGQYLIRSEVLALQVVGAPQMYIGCAQVKIAGTGNFQPTETVAIPGYIDMATPAMTVNIYERFVFEEYGPKVHGSGATISSAAPAKDTGGSVNHEAEPAPALENVRNSRPIDIEGGRCWPVQQAAAGETPASVTNWGKWNSVRRNKGI